MQRFGKKLEIAVISAGVVVLTAALSVYGLSQARLGKAYDIAVALVSATNLTSGLGHLAVPQIATSPCHLDLSLERQSCR